MQTAWCPDCRVIRPILRAEMREGIYNVTTASRYHVWLECGHEQNVVMSYANAAKVRG